LLIHAAAAAAALAFAIAHMLPLHLQLLGSLLSTQTIALTGIFRVALLNHVAEFPAMRQLQMYVFIMGGSCRSKHLLNARTSPSRPGCTKSNSAHSSTRLF
jgi:hypothetical protein